MYDVMLDEANLWHDEHEPPLRKQKIEAPPSTVEDVYLSDEEDMDPVEQEKYRRQVVESCGFDVDFCNHTYNGIIPTGCSPYDQLFAKAGLHCYNLEKGKKLEFKSVLKVNSEIGSLYNSYSTYEVMDLVNNSLHTFQTLVTDARYKNKARLVLVTKICRIKPQVQGIDDGTVSFFWDLDSIYNFYTGDMPDWPQNDKESEHLDWGMRLRIAMGSAYCLDHMHQLNPPIVSDFSSGTSETETSIIDTYISVLNPQENVYSFGLMLFEMITRKLPESVNKPESVDSGLVNFLRGENLAKMVDPTLESYDERKIENIGEVIKSCFRTDPKERPTMRQVT